MARELRCADLIPGCDFVVQGTRDSEVMRKAAEHAKRAHRMVAIAMEVEKRREQRSGMSRPSWLPEVSTLRQESRMLENRTRLLLILSQDMLDQARVIAGRATTALKLPVSLQIVLRALIRVRLKRESHSALVANIESQARAVYGF